MTIKAQMLVQNNEPCRTENYENKEKKVRPLFFARWTEQRQYNGRGIVCHSDHRHRDRCAADAVVLCPQPVLVYECRAGECHDGKCPVYRRG